MLGIQVVRRSDRDRLVFDPEINDREKAWQFALFRPSNGHLLALALRRGAGGDLPVLVREVLPLTDEVQVRVLPQIAATVPRQN